MRPDCQVTMTMRELDRLKCVQAVVDGESRPGVAAERLQKSPRQIQRLTNCYRREGPVGLLSRRRNRPSNHRIDAALEGQVLQILRKRYADFGPTLAAEKLKLTGVDPAISGALNSIGAPICRLPSIPFSAISARCAVRWRAVGCSISMDLVD